MREMKLKPFIIAFVVVLVLLVGGSFTYQYVAQEKPMQEKLDKLVYSNILLPVEKQDGSYHLIMEVAKDCKLQEAMEELKQAVQEYDLTEENYDVQLLNKSSELQEVWQGQLFAIAEIMANQQYSELPELMQTIEKGHPDVQADASMDEKYVYVTLLKDGQRFDKLLSLDGGKMEVWQDAQ